MPGCIEKVQANGTAWPCAVEYLDISHLHSSATLARWLVVSPAWAWLNRPPREYLCNDSHLPASVHLWAFVDQNAGCLLTDGGSTESVHVIWPEVTSRRPCLSVRRCRQVLKQIESSISVFLQPRSVNYI